MAITIESYIDNYLAALPTNELHITYIGTLNRVANCSKRPGDNLNMLIWNNGQKAPGHFFNLAKINHFDYDTTRIYIDEQNRLIFRFVGGTVLKMITMRFSSNVSFNVVKSMGEEVEIDSRIKIDVVKRGYCIFGIIGNKYTELINFNNVNGIKRLLNL